MSPRSDPDPVAVTSIPERERVSSPRRRFVIPVALLAAALAIGLLLVRPTADTGPPRLSVVAAAASPGGVGDMVSVYVVVANGGGLDTVRSASSDAGAAVTLHDTAEVDGGSSMVELDRLTVPAHGTLTLSPGGRHLMLHHVFAALGPGDVISLTIEFERSGPMVLEVPVRSFVDLATFGAAG